MKYTLIKTILDFFWTRRARIKKLYKAFKANPNIKFDWDISWDEVKEYAKTTYTGLIVDEQDKIVWWSDYTDNLEQAIGKNPHKTRILYTQSINSCAIYGNTRALAYNTGFELKRSEVESISDYAVEKGYRKKNKWMTFKDAAKASEEWMLANKGVRIETIRTPMFSAKYNALKELWYSCALWGGWTDEKTLDIRWDNEIDYDYTWKEKINFYHCWSEEEQWHFTDNYHKSSNNEWKNDKFEEFIKHGVNFAYCYFPILISEEEKKSYETLENENDILRRRADDAVIQLNETIKTLHPNG